MLICVHRMLFVALLTRSPVKMREEIEEGKHVLHAAKQQ